MVHIQRYKILFGFDRLHAFHLVVILAQRAHKKKKRQTEKESEREKKIGHFFTFQ